MKKLKDYMEEKKAEETAEVKIDENLVKLVKESLKKLLNKKTITDKKITDFIKTLLEEDIEIQKKIKKNRKTR